MSWAVVTTAPGRWIRAMVRDNVDDASRVEGNYSQAELKSMIDATFAVAVAKRFSSSCDLSDITRQMMCIRQRYGAGRTGSVLEMEMIVRKELGERVPIEDLPDEAVSLIKYLIVEQIVYDLGLLAEELDELIVNAEARVGGVSD